MQGFHFTVTAYQLESLVGAFLAVLIIKKKKKNTSSLHFLAHLTSHAACTPYTAELCKNK